jgi:hypothetical protein
MAITKKKLALCDRDDLIKIIETLGEKVKKKNEELVRVRSKLVQAKSNLLKMQNIVSHQRKRIVELYSAGGDHISLTKQ